MKPAATYPTLAAAQNVCNLASKLLGYPKRGLQVGGGIHVDSPHTWDGNGPTPPGWTKVAVVPMKHPDRAEWCVAIDGVEEALRDPRAVGRLTPAEQATITAAAQAAKPLDNSWKGMRE